MGHQHDYTVIKSTPAGIIEVCNECKKKLVTKTDSKGRVDNRAYLKEHIRDTAQPTGITAKIFKQYYGDK